MAGIIFAILLITSYALLLASVPPDLLLGKEWLEDKSGTVAFALGLIPFAGIAFLWFIGVIRDHLGRMEDQLFSTVFLGSGLLYLAMLFISAAIVAGLLASYAFEPNIIFESGVYASGRAVMTRILNVYGIRMAAVFMISLATIWVRTQVMPRWLAFLTYGAAAILLLIISFNPWVTLIFPAWVMVISLYILLTNARSNLGEQ